MTMLLQMLWKKKVYKKKDLRGRHAKKKSYASNSELSMQTKQVKTNLKNKKRMLLRNSPKILSMRTSALKNGKEH